MIQKSSNVRQLGYLLSRNRFFVSIKIYRLTVNKNNNN